MKILIIGHARHGKDTVGELFQEYAGLKAISSSEILAKEFLFDLMNSKYGQSYKTSEECFNDRFNWRKEWFDEISAYNTPDQTRTAKLILKHADIYVGMRSSTEVIACIDEDLFDLVIWVDATERLPLENSDSFNISKDVADIIIDNNGTLEQLRRKTFRIIRSYGLEIQEAP
jgi:dephospho-CoA kinase